MSEAEWLAWLDERLAAGRAAFERGDHAAAAALYTEALALLAADAPALRSSYEAQLYLQRGHAQFIRRDLPAAADDYGAALARDPELAEAYAYRGLIQYQLGKAVLAIADFDAAIDLYTTQGGGHAATQQALAEACFNRGNAQYQRRDFAAAVADYDAALALRPDLLEALIFRGAARFQQDDAAGALGDYRAVLRHPQATAVQRAQVLFNQGLLLRHSGDLLGAIGAYSAALELQPRDADCLMNRGSAHAARGDYLDAIADYEAALRLNPWIEDGFNTCGVVRLLAGDLAGAEHDFTRALALNPQAANVHANRGGARLQRGDFQGAIADFTAELELRSPGLKGRIETREKRAEILNNRGLAYHYAGRLVEALADYDRAVQQLRLAGGTDEIGPRLASILLNRGLARRDHGQLSAAIDDLEQALALAENPELAQEIRGLLRGLGASAREAR